MRHSPDERAVSDTIAFVLTFSIIILSVGLVSTAGFDQLENLRDDEKFKGARDGMIELSESFDAVHERTDASRSAGIDLSGGTVQFSPSSLAVTVGGSATPSQTKFDGEVLAFQYKQNDKRIVYEGGGLFADPGTVDHRPAMSCDTEQNIAIVSLFRFDSENLYLSQDSDKVPLLDTGQSGLESPLELGEVDSIPSKASVTLQVQHNTTRVLHHETHTNGRDVTISYSDSAVPSGWKQFGEDPKNDWTVDSSTQELVCSDVNQILVRSTTVNTTVYK